MCAIIEMKARLFVLMAVSNEPGDQMHDKIDGAAMTSMLESRKYA